MSNEIPAKMLTWPLYGAGMENLGINDLPVEMAVPEIKDDQLLVKIDAIGLCFSDVKLIRAGEEHPRVISENLKTDPVIPGHEAVMTVVKAGKSVADKFKVGSRFIIQADIYVNGIGFAYGYAINGGMSQYSLIDQRVLNGDEGCYLLPLSEDMPSAVAALLEPWTCVQASYMIENRKAPKKGGKVLVVSSSNKVFTIGKQFEAAAISELTVMGLDAEKVAELEKEFKVKANIISELPESGNFDDIVLIDAPIDVANKAAKLGSFGAVTSFLGDYANTNMSFDVGRIHYEGFYYQGAINATSLDCAYDKNVRSKVKKGGVCWLPGGAGAMGQMHTQLAVENPDGPSRILVSDMDSARIANVERLLADSIAKRNIEFKVVNPSTMTPAEFEQVLVDFAPEGFDDIIMLVPVVPVLEQAAKFLGKDGLMNIFAGIPAGKEGVLSLGGIVEKNQRYIGSSGSKTEHLRHTLELAQGGKLNPATALAAIGGMNALKNGLEAVIAAKFPGKTVIFPNCPDLPLTPTDKIGEISADLASTLDAKGTYTLATEKKIEETFGV